MPLYTYRPKTPQTGCSSCSKTLEVFQKFSDPPLETCPDCGNPLIKFMHAVPTCQDRSDKKLLSDDNLKKHGFKKLVNRGGGKFDEVV